jgi:hypothetical protein
VIDINCGDWSLGRETDWGNREYIGVDVVEPSILKKPMCLSRVIHALLRGQSRKIKILI